MCVGKIPGIPGTCHASDARRMSQEARLPTVPCVAEPKARYLPVSWAPRKTRVLPSPGNARVGWHERDLRLPGHAQGPRRSHLRDLRWTFRAVRRDLQKTRPKTISRLRTRPCVVGVLRAEREPCRSGRDMRDRIRVVHSGMPWRRRGRDAGDRFCYPAANGLQKAGKQPATYPGSPLPGRTVIERMKRDARRASRLSVAPMMDWTDRH